MHLAFFFVAVVAAASTTAPDEFHVTFGLEYNSPSPPAGKPEVVLKITKLWAPIGVQHFWDLLHLPASDGNSYWNNNGFFRVVPNFVVQW